jgi:hypothetical protein
MGILNNVLGINLTNHMPLKDSPFNDTTDEGESFPPPGSDFMITEDGLFMLTEDGVNLMITE